MLELYCGTVRVEVRSEEIAQPAKSRPVDAVAARKQIEKTGNTMCIFEQLTVSVEDGLFFPLRALNELRRQGIEALTEKLLGHYTRNGQPQQEREELTRADVEKVLPKQKGMQLTVSVQTLDQLEAVVRQPGGIAGVYVDLLVAGTGRYQLDVGKLRVLVQRIKEAGLSCWLNFPPVFRTQDRRLLELEAMQALLPEFDGFLLHTLDELGYVQLRGRDGQIWIGDDTFYAYNGKASGFLIQEGVGRRTLPAELNFKELMRLCNAGSDGETRACRLWPAGADAFSTVCDEEYFCLHTDAGVWLFKGPEECRVSGREPVCHLLQYDLQFRSAGSERLSEGDRCAVSELCARGIYRGIRRGDCCGIGPVKAVVCRRSNAFRIGRTGRNTGTFQKRGRIGYDESYHTGFEVPDYYFNGAVYVTVLYRIRQEG